MKQINLKLPTNLFEAAKQYSQAFGFRSIQEFITQLIRERVFGSGFDESFTDEEIELIDKIISKTIKGKLIPEEELMQVLKE